MEKVLRDVIYPSVSCFDGFVNRLGGEVVDSSHVRLGIAYSYNLVECPVALIYVSRVSATSVSW